MQRGEILMQNQITKRTRLLDAQGNVAEPGYCVHNLYDYVRSDIKANPLRIKAVSYTHLDVYKRQE